MPSALVMALLALGHPAQRNSALDARLQLVGAPGMALDLDTAWNDASRGVAPARAAALAIASWLYARRMSPAHGELRAASEGAGLALAFALLDTRSARREVPGKAWRAEQTLARHVAFSPMPYRDPRARLPTFAAAAARGGGVRIHHGQLLQLLRLLDEPTVTLRTVVGMAAQRPLAGVVVSALAAHPRWWAEAAVRAALVANPFSPGALVLPMLPTVSSHDLLRFCAETRADALAQAARLVLEVRHG